MDKVAATTEAADLLDEANAMLEFLISVSSQIADGRLNNNEAYGLSMIMQRIHTTIERASALL